MGIKEAFLNLFKKPITLEYPKVPFEKNENYRGLIEYNEEECIYCLKCEKACPPQAILFVHTNTPSSNEKNKKSLEYKYNPWLCIYCGQCVRECPKAQLALWQSNKKPAIATSEDKVNDTWFEIEKIKKEKS